MSSDISQPQQPQQPYLTKRLAINASVFGQSPVRAIKQLIGKNATLVSYKVNSIVNWSGDTIVDIVYQTIPIDVFSIYYVPINEIKQLVPNSEKYITVINGCNVKLSNPKLSAFHDYLPIRVSRRSPLSVASASTVTSSSASSSVIDVDDYERYYSIALDDEHTYEQNQAAINRQNESDEIANYYGTTVTNPLNALITPMRLLTENRSKLSFGFTLSMPNKLYPANFHAPEVYSADDCIKYYQQQVKRIEALMLIDNIKASNDPNIFKVNEISTTAYVIDVNLLPKGNDARVHGFILIQPRRIVRQILYFPTNAHEIDSDELDSIRQFIEADEINFNNYYFLKNR